MNESKTGVLVEGWKKSWKLVSVQIQAGLAAVALVEAQWGVFSHFVPDSWKPYIVATFAVAGIIARLWPQPVVAQEMREQGLKDQVTKMAVEDFEKSVAKKPSAQKPQPPSNETFEVTEGNVGVKRNDSSS